MADFSYLHSLAYVKKVELIELLKDNGNTSNPNLNTNPKPYP